MNQLVIKPFLLALSLLTRIPVRTGAAGDLEWGRSAAYFPLCGYILAFFAALPLMAMTLLSNLTQISNNAVITMGAFFFVAGMAWLTRMFHIDGFCDACDAFTSTARTKEDRLRIMKDPHPGAAANAYTILLLIGKMAAVYFVISHGQIYATERLMSVYRDQVGLHMTLLRICWALVPFGFLVAIPVVARFAMLVLAAVSIYPRETGTGAIIVGKVPALSVAVAALWLVPLGFLIPLVNYGVAIGLALLVIAYWRIKAGSLLGGVTGDILGACCETAEFAVAFGLVIPEIIR